MQQLIYKQDFAPYRNISPNVQNEKLVSPITLAQDISLREVLGNALFSDIFDTQIFNVLSIAPAGSFGTEITINQTITGVFFTGQKLRFTGFAGRLAFLNDTYYQADSINTNSFYISIDISLITNILPAEYEKATLINNYKAIYIPLMVHLIPYLVCVAYGNYILYADAQITDSGFRSKIDDDSVPVTAQTIGMLINQNKGLVKSFGARLIQHLQDNKINYPLYKSDVKQTYTRSRAIFAKPKSNKPNYNNN